MTRFVIRRLIHLVVVLFGVLTLLFVLLRVSGDPAAVIAGGDASQETIDEIRASLGLDRPIGEQYLTFIGDAVTLDFGRSFQTGQSARELILKTLPRSLQLVLASMAVAIVLAIPLGMLAAMTRSRLYQRFVDGVVLFGQAIPIFWLAIVLVWVAAVEFDLVPSIYVGGWKSWILPVISLASFPLAHMVQFTRTGLAESMEEDFTRTAIAKGLPKWKVVGRHAMRPVATSLVTIAGLDLSQMLSGVVLVEVIFAWPGIGQLLVGAVSARDYPIVETSTFFLAFLVVTINFLVDLTYERIDPRVRVS